MPFRRLSLRYKFLAIVVALLLAATAAYMGLAVGLFNADKTAYIYDTNAALVETLGSETATGLISTLKTMRLAALEVTTSPNAAVRQAAIEALARDDDEIVALRVFTVENNTASLAASYSNDTYLGTYDRDRAYADILLDELGTPLAALEKDGFFFQNAARENAPPLLATALAIRAGDRDAVRFVVTTLLRQDRRIGVFQRSSHYATSLIDARGNLLAHTDAARVAQRESLGDSPMVRQILSSPLAKGVTEFGDIILAYKKIGVGGLVVMSEIPAAEAFLASRKLIERSVQLAILVLSIAVMVSIVFSRRLTAALNRLYQGTLAIAQGDFNVRVAVDTEDEVGALSASFNHMAKEISRLLIETADKARMEKELETAQLVQDNFFPAGEQTIGPYAVSSYFKPASECGGDWWGHLQQGDELIVLIGDATGHGVPAALITAAAHSCTMTLAHLHASMPHFPLSPSFILASMNAAIFHAGRGRVKMTFFVAALDMKTGRVRYANASHEMPFICRGSLAGANGLAKEHLDALASRPDPCLGESLESVYGEHTAQLDWHDTLVLYTDGIVECRNAADEEYGERRFQKGLVASGILSATALRAELVDQALVFFADRAPEDDITLVVVQRSKHGGALKEAG